MIDPSLGGRALGLTAYKVLCASLLGIQALLIVCVPSFDDYGLMCFVSLAQTVFFIVMALASPCRQPFVILFLVANWIFHCGQIACIAAGYGTNEVLNLDFRWYGSPASIDRAFRFYLYSQTLITAGAFIFQKSLCGSATASRFCFSIKSEFLAKCLIIVGLPFWLYVNGSKLMGAASDAYHGVYSLVIPAPIQAFSFFFEAGLLLMLLCRGRERRGTVLFWVVVAVNVVLMTSGSRQYSVCFLAVWCLVYFYYLKRLSVGRAFGMILACICLLFLIDAFGELRTTGFSLGSLSSYLLEASFFGIVWDSLGEFGSAFSTLVVSVANVPSTLPYGMGASYVAGIMSAAPTLLTRFPGLRAATQFTKSIGVAFFGGSMLGEFYFNFGMLGIVGSFFVGAILASCQNRFNEIGQEGSDLGAWSAAVLSMFLLLFIRGYFTDAVMKLAFISLFSWFVCRFVDFKVGRGADLVDKASKEVDAM